MLATLRTVGLWGALALAACGSGDIEQGPEGGAPDAAVDSPPDQAEQDATEAGPDVAADAPTEADAEPLVPTEREVLIPLDGQVLFPARLDGTDAHLVVDTGAVRSAFSKTLLRDVVNGVGVTTVDFGDGIVFEDYEVLAVDLSEAENHIGVAIHGLIGQDLFQQLYFGVDYRRARAIVSRAAPSTAPTGWSEADRVTLPYEVVQGLPILTVDLEGTPARLIADTGSGVTLLTESRVPPSWLSAGLEGYVWHTSYGSDEATIVRIPSLGLGSVSVEESWAIVVPDEHHLAAVFSAIGLEVDGFLGYPVYRSFYWGIRGADMTYEVFAQPGQDPLTQAEWNRVGVELVSTGDNILIDMLFHPSSAFDEGVAVGDELLTVDGVQIESLGLDDVRKLLRGSVGDVRALGLVRDGSPVQATVKVDALLP
jgi:predicted aspartyl protease